MLQVNMWWAFEELLWSCASRVKEKPVFLSVNLSIYPSPSCTSWLFFVGRYNNNYIEVRRTVIHVYFSTAYLYRIHNFVRLCLSWILKYVGVLISSILISAISLRTSHNIDQSVISTQRAAKLVGIKFKLHFNPFSFVCNKSLYRGAILTLKTTLYLETQLQMI